MARDLGPAEPESVGLSREGLAKIDAKLTQMVEEGVYAGVVTLAARRGKIAHTSIIGLKNLETKEPLALDTIFRIYSMTKPVTGVAMMIMHDEGKWRPDDPIAEHLPEFADVKVFTGLDASGAMQLEAPAHPPTLRELLTHTAGLSYGFDPNHPIDKLFNQAKIWSAPSLADLSKRVAAIPLIYQPGTKWVYSIGMDIQGALIEKWSGQTLAAFMQERMFGPLGMVDTAFHLPPEKNARLASLYRMTKSRGLVSSPPLVPMHTEPPKLASGGGGLYSTLHDYARFAQMILNGGEFGGARIVSADALKLQMSNHLSDALINGGYGIGQQQIRPGFGHGFDGAVFYDPAASGVPVGKGTYHWDGAAGTWFWVDPTNDLLYIGLVQLFSETAPNIQKITQTMMADAIL